MVSFVSLGYLCVPQPEGRVRVSTAPRQKQAFVRVQGGFQRHASLFCGGKV